MSGRCLKRPLGGWSARQWRREVAGWLLLALLYVFASGASAFLYRAIDIIAGG